MKVDSKIFRGIEYVELDELPQAQQDILLQTMTQNHFIKIMIEGKILEQCLQYRDYSHWYETVFARKLMSAKGLHDEAVSLDLKPDLILGKV